MSSPGPSSDETAALRAAARATYALPALEEGVARSEHPYSSVPGWLRKLDRAVVEVAAEHGRDAALHGVADLAKRRSWPGYLSDLDFDTLRALGNFCLHDGRDHERDVSLPDLDLCGCHVCTAWAEHRRKGWTWPAPMPWTLVENEDAVLFRYRPARPRSGPRRAIDKILRPLCPVVVVPGYSRPAYPRPSTTTA